MDRSQVMSLAQNLWVRSHQNILVTGPTGAGKSYLACALAQKARRPHLDGTPGHRSRVDHEEHVDQQQAT